MLAILVQTHLYVPLQPLLCAHVNDTCAMLGNSCIAALDAYPQGFTDLQRLVTCLHEKESRALRARWHCVRLHAALRDYIQQEAA